MSLDKITPQLGMPKSAAKFDSRLFSFHFFIVTKCTKTQCPLVGQKAPQSREIARTKTTTNK